MTDGTAHPTPIAVTVRCSRKAESTTITLKVSLSLMLHITLVLYDSMRKLQGLGCIDTF
jgi:hypothetical protein